MKHIFHILILSMFLGALSCSAVKHTSREHQSDYSASEMLRTAYIRDSIFITAIDTVKLVEKGDTIYKEVIRWRTSERIKEVYDTLIIRDTVRQEIEKEVLRVEVEKYPFYKKYWFTLILLSLLIVAKIAIKRK